MENNFSPKVLQLIDEVEMLAMRIDERLSHILLPKFPTSVNEKTDIAESAVTYKLRRIIRSLGEINDRIEQ